MQAEQKLILVVDDEPDICDELSLFIRKLGHSVVTAHGGEKALEIFSETKPDLVLTDYIMPGINGTEMVERMKKQNGALQVIMMTGTSDIETLRTTLEKVVTDIVMKPVDLSELAMKIEMVLDDER